MAGVMMEGDYGMEVKMQSVPTIDGEDTESPGKGYANVVASAHLSDADRANGVLYPANPGVAVTSKAYPSGTVMTDTTKGDDVN